MGKLIINGGRSLSGTVIPHGSKNAVLPLIFASLAMDGVSVLHGVPDITDVRIAVDIVRSQGVAAEFHGSDLTLDARFVKYKKPDRELMSSIRASAYLMGASLARFGCFHVSEIGGCNFCDRPIDMHLYAAEVLGAVTYGDELRADRLCGREIKFEKRSVGATINALIMASAAEGITHISGAANEPHVQRLIEFLVSAGASVSRSGDVLEVRGQRLCGGEITVIPDMIEAGTYLMIGAATRGRVTVRGCESLGLDGFFKPLVDAGVSVIYGDGGVTLCGIPYDELHVVTQPYPGYPTDLQPQAAPLMALGCGGTITENVWQSRFSYLQSLSRFGLRYEISGKCARIFPSSLTAAESYATDLRGGASAVICALAAKGESVINEAQILSRGYADLVKNIASLGADIKEIK